MLGYSCQIANKVHTNYRLRVVSNFGDGDCGAGEIHTRARKFEETRRELSRARVYFARPTIAIAKIRDYSQSTQINTSQTK